MTKSKASGETVDTGAAADPAELSISEVSRRTGIPVAGLRNWEQRYGVPRPLRSSSGRRRYRESDCAVLTDVLRRRASGLSLPAAIAQAVARGGDTAELSIFAALRRRQPGLRVHLMTKTVLLALTRAIEDECCARAQQPVLMASFQRQRFYRASRARWTDLARNAELAVVFADFDRSRRQPGSLLEIAVPETSPMRREWTLICDAPDQLACVAGWEHPGQQRRPDADRTFEVLWSVDPQVVRTAARIGADLASASAPEVAGRPHARLGEEVATASADLQRASGLIERTLDYLSR